MPITIYGIKNCDTMKKARAWLDKHGVDYAFHDYKTAGIEREQAGSAGRRRPAGRRCSTAPARTFKKLPDKDKEGVTEKKAIALMLAQPSMIKRPVLELGGGKLLVGFKPEQYAAGSVTVAYSAHSRASAASRAKHRRLRIALGRPLSRGRAALSCRPLIRPAFPATCAP